MHWYTSPRAERKAEKQPVNRPKPILCSTKKAANDPKEDSESHTTAHPNGTSTKKATSAAQQVDGMETPQKAASAKVQSAISKAQEKTQKETEMKNAMCGRICKGSRAEPPSNIESHHVEHIVNATLDYAFSYQQQVDKPNAQSLTTRGKTEQHSGGAKPHKANRPQGKTETWAEKVTLNFQIVAGKSTLAHPLKGIRPDKRLMVRLGQDLPYRGEHPFILQKKANAVLPNKVVIGKVAYINSGLALIPAPGTTAEQLKEHKEILAQVFGICYVEQNEK